MKLFSFFFLLTTLYSGLYGTPRQWAHDTSDILPDPAVTYGLLENGMRYAILPNNKPKGRVSLRLHVAAGSLMEREDQRGLAHFLEHMVFNGSRYFPNAKSLIPKMQRLGIAFGAHANAYTAFDETVYMLDLPNKKPETLKLAFQVMRDFADGALLQEAEINKERGVILSEKTSRDSVAARLMEQQFKTLMPDAKITHRFPIGLQSVIQNAPRQAFVDFYTQYYIPQNMTFVLVGDLTLEEAKQRITTSFGDMKNPEQPGEAPDMGSLPKNQGFQCYQFNDKELSQTEISLTHISPYTPQPDTKETTIKILEIAFANSMLSERLDLLSKKKNAPIISGASFYAPMVKWFGIGNIEVTAKNHDWKRAFSVLQKEFRRAFIHGFTHSELNEQKAKLLNDYHKAVLAHPTRKTPYLATALIKHIHEGLVYSTPEEALKVIEKSLQSITPESCHKAFKTLWDSPDITLILTSPKKIEQAESTLKALYEKGKNVQVTPAKEQKALTFAYPPSQKEGHIITKKYIKDLDFYQITLDNGIVCNIKKTNFNKNAISLLVRVGSGKLTAPKDKPGLSMAASAFYNLGGLGKHSIDELRRLFAGRNVGVAFQVGDDFLSFSGTTTPRDLALELDLLKAMIQDPGFRPEAQRLFRAQIPAIYAKIKHSVASGQVAMQSYLYGNDYRSVFPSEKQLSSRTLDEARAWLMPQIAKDYMEVTLVGDLDIQATLKLVEKTLGTLPPRAKARPSYDQQRQLQNLPSAPISKRYTFQSAIPSGLAIVMWKTDGLRETTIGKTRRLGILGSIFTERMREKIREELGASYSPYAGNQPSDIFPTVGYFMAASPGKPEQAQPVGKIIVEIADTLAREGATQDEFDRAMAPRLAELHKTTHQNDYWLSTVLATCQQAPYHLTWARQRDADYKAITLEEVNALARQYLTKDKALRFEIIPVKKLPNHTQPAKKTTPLPTDNNQHPSPPQPLPKAA